MPRNYSLDRNTPTAHQRLPDYVRDDVWIRDFLHRGQIAHIASLWDDQPFIIPTTYFFDEAGHRLIFHSNVTGRIRANIDQHPRVCIEVSEVGKLLPSNVALEFSLQFRSVTIFGSAFILENRQEQRAVMHQLIAKYFEKMELGRDYRPASDKELERISIYEIRIESWSGKENWKQRADQSEEWIALDPKWFE
jgi:uncharacterized protein